MGVIIISGLNQLETAVSCIRQGAYDYFVKTCEEDRLIEGVRRAVRMLEMRLENQAMRRRFLTDTLERPEVFAGIITQDKGMRSVFQYLESVAASSQPVLITGESGVGKEQIAHSIHRLSGRPGPWSVSMWPGWTTVSLPTLCLATRKAPLPVPTRHGQGWWNRPPRAPSFWTRSAI